MRVRVSVSVSARVRVSRQAAYRQARIVAEGDDGIPDGEVDCKK